MLFFLVLPLVVDPVIKLCQDMVQRSVMHHCQCDEAGSTSIYCDLEGKCECKDNYFEDKCHRNGKKDFEALLLFKDDEIELLQSHAQAERVLRGIECFKNQESRAKSF